MDWTSSTPYSRELGDELRRFRETCTQHTGAGLAELLGWDASKVSTIEKGKARATDLDLAQYLTVCGKARDTIDEFTRRYRRAFDLCFAQELGENRTLMLAERTADTITGYSPMSVPDLLRTASYAEQSLRLTGTSADDIQSAVDSQLKRQAILYAHNRPDITFYVAEAAVRCQHFERNVARGQISHLIRTANILRIIPTGSIALLSAAFTLYEYDKMPAVVFTETHVANVFLQDKYSVGRCRSAFDVLDSAALNAPQSRELLIQILDEEHPIQPESAIATDAPSEWVS
ncbi:Helix-turn-helix domain-containing protein [Lentzea flava]|nr:Helix-turn-helix domain-containing protein [Lentzea flava]